MWFGKLETPSANREGSIVKKAVLLFLAVAACAMISACRNYGYRPYFGGGPHLDYLPEWTFPIITAHKPVPYEELKEVYPPDMNISGQ